MKHTFNILKAIFRLSFSHALEYRAEVFGSMIAHAFFTVSNLLALYVVIAQTSILDGWTAGELVLFYLFGLLVFRLLDMFIFNNLRELPELIRTGNFDFLIMRPASSLLLLSFRILVFRGILEVITLVGLIIFAVIWLGIPVTFLSVIGTIVFLIIALITGWAFLLFLLTWSFWLIQIDNVGFLANGAMGLARIPVSFYGKVLGLLLSSLIPASIIGNLPVQILVGKVSSGLIGWSLLVAVLYVVIAITFYNYAVKDYSSASS